MIKAFLLVSGLIISPNLNAQFDKEKFEEVFKQETEGDEKYNNRDSHSTKYSHTRAQDIPQWLFEPPTSDNKSIVAIGISDPGLDSTDAMQMAIYRAQIMANILRKSTTQLLCDFFLNEEACLQQIVYEHFSRIMTQMPDSMQNYEVLETYVNQFDETIVLINYSPPESTNNLKFNNVFLELYKNETEHSIYGGYESIYELLVKHNGDKTAPPMFYQLTEYGPRNDVVGAIYESEYEVPIYSLSYNCYVSDSVNKMYLSHGLWKEYFKSIISNILMVAREKPENIKVMGDKYQEEASNSDSYEKLTRGLSVNKMSFIFEGIKAEKNSFSVKLREVSLVKPGNLHEEY